MSHTFILLIMITFTSLLLVNSEAQNPECQKMLEASGKAVHMVVAKDGSGNYTTISGAVAAAVSGTVIHVRRGLYRENVVVNTSAITLVGDGIDETIVTASRSFKDGFSTHLTATFTASGEGFIACGITFENTAGAAKEQAVALLSSSERSVFFRCSFLGYQDTLFVRSDRQFYSGCDIYGTVDFIFGDAAAVMDNCTIYLRQPLHGEENTVTAHGRADPIVDTGIVFLRSRIVAAPGQTPGPSYLGRPWKSYSRVVFIKCFIDDVIAPEGWRKWNKTLPLNSTVYYAEYMNTGGGADTRRRVTWPGVHVSMTAQEAAAFTAQNFLGGDSWIPATGVPYTPGL